MNDWTCVKEMLLKSFVYTDAERERESMVRSRETKGRRWRWREKKIETVRLVCVLVGGN